MPTPTPTPGFSATGSMTVGRHLATATLLRDGRVLITGGFTGLETPRKGLATAELYDPKTGEFSPTGSMAQGRFGHTATLLPDGRVLIAGGSDGSRALASAELYNPQTETFTATGSMVAARGGQAATSLSDGDVLLTGGAEVQKEGEHLASANGVVSLSSAELYHSSTGLFSSIGSMTTARDTHSATVLKDGRVLVVGGQKWAQNWTGLSSAEIYDPSSGKFGKTGSMTTDRYPGTYTVTPLSDGQVLVAGGMSAGTPLYSAELYNPVTGRFSQTGPLRYATAYHVATLLSDGRVLIAGGTETLNAELYDPSTGKFAFAGAMLERRNFPMATLLSDGRVLITGGDDISEKPLASAELYQP